MICIEMPLYNSVFKILFIMRQQLVYIFSSVYLVHTKVIRAVGSQ